MPRIPVLLLAAFAFILSTSLAASPRSLDVLHSNFRTFDRQIAEERISWQTPYQQAIELARSAQPEQALPIFETLLDTLVEQEPAFARVYTRYFALSQHLGKWYRTAQFLQTLSVSHPRPWVLGAQREALALGDGWTTTHSLVGRMQAQQEHAELAQYLLLPYLLTWPYGFDGEAAYKQSVANQLADSLEETFDRRGIDQLARWRYQRTPTTSPGDAATWQNTLEQALPTGRATAIVGAFSHYLAALIAANRLEDGLRWAQSQQATNDNPALALIADVLGTAHANQRRFEQALAAMPALRQQAPDSLLLAQSESNLRYFTLTQGFAQADTVLAAFSQRQPHNENVQRAVRFQRAILAGWVKLPGRTKRDTLPTVSVTGSMYSMAGNPNSFIFRHFLYRQHMRRLQLARPAPQAAKPVPKADSRVG